MNIEVARNLAYDLLKENNLEDWTVSFNKSTTRLGQCWYGSKVIALSLHMMNSSDDGEIIDTIRHEIGHAIVGPHVKDAHGEEWIELGRKLNYKTSSICGDMNPDSGKGLLHNEIKPLKKLKTIQQACPICGELAVEVSRASFTNKDGSSNTWIRLKCKHLIKLDKLEIKDYTTLESQTGKKMFPYQVEGSKFVEAANGRALIADEAGLGKTIQALSTLHFHPEMLPCLWVCKTTLKLQTLKESLDWFYLDLIAQIVDKGTEAMLPGFKVYIVSMDLLRRIKPEKLKSLGIKTVVVDEVQHFKNPESRRTTELRNIVREVDHVILLSATPWKNRGSEYFVACNMLEPRLFPSYQKFIADWVDWYQETGTGKYKMGGIKNITRFKELTKHFIIRRERDDVLPDLPKINRNTRFVELEGIFEDSYEKEEIKVAAIIKDAILEGKSMNNIQTELMKLKHLAGLAKVDIIVEDAIEFLENTDNKRKLTIGHHHIDVGDLIEMKLNAWMTVNGQSKVLRLKGGEDAYKRNDIVTRFQEGDNRVMLASTLASGEGLNLQFCYDAMQAERQWNPANEEQFELRFSRPGSPLTGSGESIKIPYFVAGGTVDELLTAIVDRKRVNFKKAMNRPRCSHCGSINAKLVDDVVLCKEASCGKETHIKWNEESLAKELADALLKKRYGNKAPVITFNEINE